MSTSYRTVAGALRKSGGVWGIIDDEGHTPQGIVSVSDEGTHLKINYGFTAKTVGALVVTPDEAYNLQGYSFGSSVGLASAKIFVSQSPSSPAGGYVSFDGDNWSGITGNVSSVEVVSDNTIKVRHPEVTPATDIYVSIVGRGPGDYIYRSGGAGKDYTNVEIYNLDGTPVNTFKTDMKVFVTRVSGAIPGNVPPAQMPEGMSNIWVYGTMEV